MRYTHGGDIYTYGETIDFSVNINPLGPSKTVIDAAKKALLQSAAYPDCKCRKLKEKLADELHTEGRMLVFGNGAAELLYTLVLAEKPKKALLPIPSFSEYERALKTVECEIKYYQTKKDNGFCIDFDFLEELTEEVDIIFLCSPCNPSGKKTDIALLKKIADRCEQEKIRLVLDECFLDFENAPESLFDKINISHYPHLFLLRAFTKTYAIPGIRLGYGLTSDEKLLEKMEMMRQPWNVSVIAQAAGIAALDEKERVMQMRRIVQEERIEIEKQLHRLNIDFISSDANFILMNSEINLFEELLKYGILIRDCKDYRGLGTGWYRIAVRQRHENEQLIKALKEITEKSRQEADSDGETDHDTRYDVKCGKECAGRGALPHFKRGRL